MKIYNTLSRIEEGFSPQNYNEKVVTMYACGPTVYDYQHIGHMRRYVGDDILIRVLKYNGFEVHNAMNITDVGHLTSDSDTGEDKMEKGARKFSKTVWDLAKMFEEQFKDSCQALNIKLPKDLMHATGYIREQIDLINEIDKNGYAYRIEDGIYFDVKKYSEKYNYFELSKQNPDEIKAGIRVELVEGKRSPYDFALWKFDLARAKNGFPQRAMNWWFEGKSAGEPLIHRPATEEDVKQALPRWFNASDDEKATIGFPGWHIECSAMSRKALGETFDIHTGGIDHVNIHHTNEIAQSVAATGEQPVRYWVHHAFLMVEGEKMSKSLGNIYTVQDIIEKNYDPLALRYLYLQTHYRQEMNFTFEALTAAQNALNRLRKEVSAYDQALNPIQEYEDQFKDAINDDLNMPKALSVLWEVVKSDKKTAEKAATVFKFDEVLGLSLNDSKVIVQNEVKMPEDVQTLLKEREALRKEKKFTEADKIRERIIEMGYKVEDK